MWVPRLKELEVREEMLKVVGSLVGLDKVESHLRMIFGRRRFLRERDRASAAARGMCPLFLLSCFVFVHDGPWRFRNTDDLDQRDAGDTIVIAAGFEGHHFHPERPRMGMGMAGRARACGCRSGISVGHVWSGQWDGIRFSFGPFHRAVNRDEPSR